MTRTLKAGEKLELAVANAYRQIGAWKVEHDVEMAGNQIDVYAELATPGHSLHRIAIEVKDWKSPVGIDVVNRFSHVVELLRNERLVDEGIIVSSVGFSRPARSAARSHGVRLLELADLDAMIDQTEAPGWIQAPMPAPPLPPKPYFARPYAMQENFSGRIRERQMLSEWFMGDQRPFLTLTAMGGMGKSALAWVWMLRDLLDLPLSGLVDDSAEASEGCRVPENQRPEGVMWWSFYDAETNFAAFLDKALVYASSGRLDPSTISSTHDKVRVLVNLLQDHHLLIIFDGFERELRAYANLSAPYQGDAVPEDGRENYRACTDVHASNFLRWAAALTLRSRLVLTSRLLPGELDELAGCRRENLTALEPEDAVTFFRAQGVQGSRSEIMAACEPCGYHPLTLRLLTGLIAKDPIQPGDVAAVGNYDLINDLVPKEQHFLALAYDALSPGLQELLSRLAASRSPVGYEVAATLSPFKTKRELGLAFSELADRGLIFFDQDWWRYDLHPIVRAYAYDRLVDKEAIHNQLRIYFTIALAQESQQVSSIEDLTLLIELYHHTVHAGRYDEAAELFHDYLADPLYYRFGAYRTEISLLRALFPEDGASVFPSGSGSAGSGEIGLPRLKDPSAQAWILNAMASSYTCAGQASYAVPLLKTHNMLQEELGDTASYAVGLENLAGVQLELGELREAERNLRHSIEWGQETGQQSIEASGRTELGRLLAYQGAFEDASRELDAAMAIQREIGHVQSQVLTWIYRAQLALLRGKPQAVLDAAQAALQLADATENPAQSTYTARSYVWAYWLLGAAHHALGHPSEAETHLGKALSRCHHINLVELEPDILLSWARWHRANSGERLHALESAETASSIANRSEYRLKQAEIHNFLALWELDAGDLVKARKHAEMAKAYAWCDGPPHCYKPALDEAEGILELVAEPPSVGG